jgi:hypothetical protein
MTYKIKSRKSKPKGYGKGIIIDDSVLNQSAWYDKEKVKLTPKTKNIYISKNIRHNKRFKTFRQARKHAIGLAIKLKKPIYDRDTGQYITIEE